jgi:hypothetical protein
MKNNCNLTKACIDEAVPDSKKISTLCEELAF